MALLGGLSRPYGRDQLQGYTGVGGSRQVEHFNPPLVPQQAPGGLSAQRLGKAFCDPAS